ncbi:Bug family tripartite tricarboxylate transporter substrate binding protein [Xylophilus sp. ASV27]|uniref:Bug family tripartite tricarboxylate transporter substrate binding protein n=1 Tax=Xylophilus sp. ASV27 TaxID=2795129 RepID=UPI0018EA5BC1
MRAGLNAAIALGIPVAKPSVAGASRSHDAFPVRPVKLFVPFTPGTSGDLWARQLAPTLEARWRQPVIVENKPGAGGLIGAEQVARAQADGHTLLVGSQSTAFAKFTLAGVRIDPLADLDPVIKFLNYKMLLVVSASTHAKARSPEALLALSRASQGGLFFGSVGVASQQSVKNGILAEGIGLRFTPVEYPGVAQTVIALVRDEVQYILATPASVKTFIDNGSAVPMAALADTRYADWPAVPSIRELGLKGYLPDTWGGLFAPQGTSLAITERIGRDIQLAVDETKDLKARIESSLSGSVPLSDPQSFRSELNLEAQQLRAYLQRIHFTKKES